MIPADLLPDPAFGITDRQAADIARGWLQLLDDNGLEVVASEAKVVNDELKLAGTLDRLVRLTRHLTFGDVTIAAGSVVVLDIKGLALDTPIPTPSGWTTIGEVKVGDVVFDSLGRPCNVTAKSAIRERPCYRIVFDDGTQVISDDEHRWSVHTGEAKPFRHQVLTTMEIAESVIGPRGQRQHRVGNAGALICAHDAALPVAPYVFGLWLGDGIALGGRICKPADSDVWRQLTDRGHELRPPSIDQRTGCAMVTVTGLRTQLRLAGLLGDKRVPDRYLRTDITQRLELLRGLMDSDGTWNKARNRAMFTSTSKHLAHVVYELATSLGERVHMSEVQRTGYGVTVTAYDVEWAPLHYNPFAEQGKRDRAKVRNTGSNWRRLIVSVEEVPSVPTQCIAVDSPDHTYLCTESMIVTHNTSKLHADDDGLPGYWDGYPLQIYAYATGVPYIIEEHWEDD